MKVEARVIFAVPVAPLKMADCVLLVKLVLATDKEPRLLIAPPSPPELAELAVNVLLVTIALALLVM